MSAIQKVYQEIYQAKPPTEPSISTYKTYNIDNKTPKEEEIVQALKRMRLNKAPGPLGITINMLQNWHFYRREKEEKYGKV
jgi:hypothetical protein